jgi:LytR cell envelope-related transcriptional attenuator
MSSWPERHSLLRSTVVTIPGRGDLSPPHRASGLGRVLVVVVVVALLAAGGYAAYRGLTGSSSGPSASALPLCPRRTVVAVRPPHSRRVTVMNATQRDGLAATVADELEKRGFDVTSIGNTPAVVRGVAIVRYPAGHRMLADDVASQITGATLVRAAKQSTVEIDLGPRFTSLAKPRQAKLAFDRMQAGPTPSPTPGTCRPRGTP